jgi:hypothetical protein
MPRPTAAPPVLAVRILSGLLPEFSREAILGDMQETFAQLVLEKGQPAASRWYWHETLAALPGFAWHALNATQLRRQIVIGNIWNENWFGKQDSRVSAGVSFLLLLPGLLVIGLAVLVVSLGKPFEAGLNGVPGVAQLMASLYSGFLNVGGVDLPIGILIMAGILLASVVNLLAIVQIKIEKVKDAYRFTFTIKHSALNLVMLGLVGLLLVGMDWLIT